MNPRERILVLVLLGAVVFAGGGFLIFQLYWKPMRAKQAAIDDYEKRIAAREQQLNDLLTKKSQLERWKKLSLPPNVHMAWGEYQKYLNELLAESEFAPGAMTIKHREPDTNPAVRGKKPAFIRLTYTMQGHGTLTSFVKFLERFYRTPLLHQVKSVRVLRPQTARPGQQAEELDVNLTVEALILEGVDPKRDTLLPKEKVTDLLVLAEQSRRYPDISLRNIFLGPPPSAPQPLKDPVDLTRYVHLTDITSNERRTEAFLFDRYNNLKTRLRSSAGFDSFRITDSEGETLIRGEVLRIEERDVTFKVGEKYYTIHIGQSLNEAMRKALSADQIKELKTATTSR